MRLMFHCILLGFIAQSLIAAAEFFNPFNVSYDGRAMIIDGQRRILISGGIHYPRATPQMWPDLISKSKDGGIDIIETYVFWNGHEPVKGQYNFEGRYDIVKFAKIVGSNGLYLFLRIGPYVCAEWNFGGFPVWLRDIPGVEFRTNNTPFKEEMKRFVKKIVDMMLKESLFAWQGGPIIMLQIENEYGNIQGSYGHAGKEYTKWAAEMAVGLGAGVPWVMCKQVDAPEYIIDGCNGYYCDGFRPNSKTKPVIWSEAWDGWFTSWGNRVPHRPAEDLAFAVARFFQRGGSLSNYYMYFGGTSFGRTAGGPNYITSYDYDAPLDEYGLLSQPKWGHLKDLNAAIKLCEPALVAVQSPEYIKLGPKQEAHVYRDNGKCSAFLASIDERRTTTVKFFNTAYTLLPWSVIILPDCRNIAFDTAKIGTQTSIKDAGLGVTSYINNPASPKLMAPYEAEYISKTWKFVKEPIGGWSNSTFTHQGILEHLSVTKDQTDYLWYTTRVHISAEDISFWKEEQVSPQLSIDSMRDFVSIFVNDQFQGSAKGKWKKVVQPVDLTEGPNDVTLLSETVGLQNDGAFMEKDGAGFRGRIKITGCKNGDIDLTDASWTYQVGLKGETMKFYTGDDNENIEWTPLPSDAAATRFSWYKTSFDVPSGIDPISLNFKSMGKGQAWVNGHHIGRYWILNAPNNGCQTCDYRGAYNPDKCAINCGEPTQNWYHVPREWLQESGNELIIFEEMDKNPFNISIKSRFLETICADVSENHYPPLRAWSYTSDGTISFSSMAPEMELSCNTGSIISSIEFASYGTPRGRCQSFSIGNCHAPNSFSVVSQACVGKQSCRISVSNAVFGDPCRHVVKTLSVELRCSSTTSVLAG